MDFIAHEVAPKKGKKVVIPIFVSYDIEADEVDDVTSTVANTSPSLYLFFNKDGAFEFGRIGGDRQVIDCKCNEVHLAVMMFIGSFFVFDIGYPKDFKHFLGFLQQSLLGIAYVQKGEDKKNCENFIMKFEGAMDKLAHDAKFKKFAD